MGSIPTLDAAPPSPPEVTGQQGQSPFAGVGSMLQKNAGGGPPGAGAGPANPRGALVAMSDTIKKVIDQMAKMESGFGPFADRIRSLLDAGLGSVMSGQAQPQSQSQPGVMSPSQRPDQGAPGSMPSFPG